MADFYWIATTTHNCNDTDGFGNKYWALTSGGPGQPSMPTVYVDDIHFDANGVGNCVVSVLFQPHAVDITSGYPGTVSVTGATGNLRAWGNTTVAGGTLSVTSGGKYQALLRLIQSGSSSINVDATSFLECSTDNTETTEFNAGSLTIAGLMTEIVTSGTTGTLKFDSGLTSNFSGELDISCGGATGLNLYPGGIHTGIFKILNPLPGLLINPGEEFITDSFIPDTSSIIYIDSIGGAATHYFTIPGGATITMPSPTTYLHIKNSLAVNSAAPIYVLGGSDGGSNDKYWVFVQFTVIPSAGAHGAISPSGVATVDKGWDSPSYTTLPSVGYYASSWTIDGGSVPITSSYQFTNVTTNHTIVANFTIYTYTLTYTAGADGDIVGTAVQYVNHGGNGTAVTPTPYAGCYFLNWSDASTANPRQDLNVTGNIGVTATFALNAPGGGMLTLKTKPKYPILNRKNKLGLCFSNFVFHEGAGANIYDISGNSHHGNLRTVLPEPQWGSSSTVLYQSITGPDLVLDGIADRIEAPASSFPVSGSFSISLWLNSQVILNTGLVYDKCIFHYADSTSTADVKIRFNGSSATGNVEGGTNPGTLSFEVVDASAVKHRVRSIATGWVASTWYNIVATYNAKTGTMTLYVNGASQGTTTSATRGATAPALLYFGNCSYDVTPSYDFGFNGVVDNVIIYDFELAANEVTTLYNDPYCYIIDQSKLEDSTNNESDFRLNCNEIIKSALRKLGISSDQATPTQLEEAREALNVLIKSLQNEGTRLWTLEWVTKPIVASSTVLVSSVSYTCIRHHISNSSNKPGYGSDWKTFWTISGTSDRVWAEGESYQCSGDIDAEADTLLVESALIRDGSGQQDSALTIIPRNQYFKTISNKYEEAEDPIYFILEPGLSPRITLWPIPSNTDRVLHYLRVRKLKNMTDASDDLDFWERWTAAIVYGVAANLADEYGLPIGKCQWLRQIFENEKNKAKSQDHEISDGEFVRKAY